MANSIELLFPEPFLNSILQRQVLTTLETYALKNILNGAKRQKTRFGQIRKKISNRVDCKGILGKFIAPKRYEISKLKPFVAVLR